MGKEKLEVSKFFIFLNFFLDPAKKGAVEWL